jgi:hypothetical protein
MVEILRKGRRGTLTCCYRATYSRNFEATAVAGASAADGARGGRGMGGRGRTRWGRPVAWAAGGSKETRERQSRRVEKGERKIRLRRGLK